MAEYKVVDGEQLDSDLTAIADVIREKSGGTEALTMGAMVDEIGKLPAAAKPSTVTVSVTNNRFTESDNNFGVFILRASTDKPVVEQVCVGTPVTFTLNIGDSFAIMTKIISMTSINLTVNVSGVRHNGEGFTYANLDPNYVITYITSRAYLFTVTGEAATVTFK